MRNANTVIENPHFYTAITHTIDDNDQRMATTAEDDDENACTSVAGCVAFLIGDEDAMADY